MDDAGEASGTAVAMSDSNNLGFKSATPRGEYSIMSIRLQRLSALAALSGILMGGSAAPSFAGTATTSFSVTATVANSCIVSAATLAFPTYLPTATTATTGSTTLNVTCTLSDAYTVALSNGSGTGADPTAGASGRKMTGPSSALLAYNLYQDAGYTQAWGSTGAYLLSGTGTGVQQALTVYGRVPASQVAAAGSYSDTINVTVTF